MSDLEARVSNIVDTINDETADLNPNERTMVWLFVKELVDASAQHIIFETMKLSQEEEKQSDYMRNLSVAEAKVNVCEQSPETFSQLKSKYQRYKASGHDNRFMNGYSEGFRCCANVLGIDVSDWDY